MKIVDYLMIGATIRIGQEILCLPYAGFLLQSNGASQWRVCYQWGKHHIGFLYAQIIVISYTGFKLKKKKLHYDRIKH